jgi:hypothetical protein
LTKLFPLPHNPVLIILLLLLRNIPLRKLFLLALRPILVLFKYSPLLFHLLFAFNLFPFPLHSFIKGFFDKRVSQWLLYHFVVSLLAQSTTLYLAEIRPRVELAGVGIWG